MATGGLNLSFLFEGVHESLRYFQEFGEAARINVVGQITTVMHDVIMNRTPVDNTPRGLKKGAGGHMKERWKIDLQSLGFGATIGNPQHYGRTLEKGEYRVVGPRTQASGSGIYSRQAVGGIIKPLLDNPAILQDAIDTATGSLKSRMSRLITNRGA